MAKIDDTIFCDGCGVEIQWVPVVKGQEVYCCLDCRDGIRCTCREIVEFEDERRGTNADVDQGAMSD